MKKLLNSSNFLVIIQILIFIIGASLMLIDGSGGYIDKMSILSIIGIILMIYAIAFQWILAGFSALFKK